MTGRARGRRTTVDDSTGRRRVLSVEGTEPPHEESIQMSLVLSVLLVLGLFTLLGLVAWASVARSSASSQTRASILSARMTTAREVLEQRAA